MIDPSAFIHPLAHVDGATIGAGTKVWQFASITRGTVLGKRCSVSPFAMLDGSIYGDDVVISCGFAAGAGFRVGSRVFFGPGVLLANDCWPAADKGGYDDLSLRSGDRFAVVIEDDVIIGGHAVIMPGVRIGTGAVVAANAVARRDVPAGMVLASDGSLSEKPADWRQKRMRWAT